jgi:hypothetical protein
MTQSIREDDATNLLTQSTRADSSCMPGVDSADASGHISADDESHPHKQ